MPRHINIGYTSLLLKLLVVVANIGIRLSVAIAQFAYFPPQTASRFTAGNLYAQQRTRKIAGKENKMVARAFTFLGPGQASLYPYLPVRRKSWPRARSCVANFTAAIDRHWLQQVPAITCYNYRRYGRNGANVNGSFSNSGK